MEAVSILSSASYLSTSPHNDYITFAEVCLLDVLLLWCSEPLPTAFVEAGWSHYRVCVRACCLSLFLLSYMVDQRVKKCYMFGICMLSIALFLFSKITIHGRLGFKL
ncbi:unnamed protein product [Brassica rapa subsp. trilocularis]